jgi:hypothetical protein
MATIVGVHGINQQLKGPEVLRSEWWPPLKDGITAAGRQVADGALACAFYGWLFRAPGTQRGDQAYGAADLDDPFEQELLQLMWEGAAATEPERVVAPSADVRGTSKVVQAGLRALSHSRFFALTAESVMIGSLKQVRRYMTEPEIRSKAQEAVDAVVTADTRVIVAHSLGSVVAYEALHRYASSANWANVHTLVTLGSPLGIRNLIFDRLSPAPENGKGKWPSLLRRWTNISDDSDVVALQKLLRDFFPGGIADMRIDNEAYAHDAMPYLTARETGGAIAEGL